MLANLTRVVAGERYVIDPFLDHYPRNRRGEPQFLSTSGKVRALREMLGSVNHNAVVETLDWFFHASVRNTFAHADYTLHDDQFRSRSEWFERSGVRTSQLPLDVVADIVNRALAFYDAFMREYDQQRSSYRTNKIVIGRIGGGPEGEPVELLADDQRGLYGFGSPPGDEAAALRRLWRSAACRRHLTQTLASHALSLSRGVHVVALVAHSATRGPERRFASERVARHARASVELGRHPAASSRARSRSTYRSPRIPRLFASRQES